MRHICAGDDAACAVAPDGMLGRTGTWADNQPADGYGGDVASMTSMLLDGSLLRSLGPRAADLVAALLLGDFTKVDLIFKLAAEAPGLRGGQRRALLLAGQEILQASASVNAVVAGQIPDRVYTGNVLLDRALNIFVAARVGVLA